VGQGDRRGVGESAEPREKGGSAGLLCWTGRARARRDRSDWAVAMVRADVGGAGTRGVDRRCRQDSRRQRPPAEDGPAGCRTDREVVGPGPFSADLEAHVRRARCAAVVVASAQAGEDAHTGEEPIAGASFKPRNATEVEAVDREGTEGTAGPATAAVGQPAESGVVNAARPTGGVHRGVEPSGPPAGQHTTGGAALDDPSGRWAGDRAGLCANGGARRTLSSWQAGGQLLGADSHGTFQWGEAAVGPS